MRRRPGTRRHRRFFFKRTVQPQYRCLHCRRYVHDPACVFAVIGGSRP